MIFMSLVRDISTPQCTLGVLHLPGRKLFTIERPWVPDPICKSGKKYVSCVSEGVYRIERHNSERYPMSYALVNPALDVYHYPYDVPKNRQNTTRTAILIHAGNFWWDVIGCIAPGKGRFKRSDGWMVTQSREAMNEVKTIIGTRTDVQLEIRYATVDETLRSM